MLISFPYLWNSLSCLALSHGPGLCSLFVHSSQDCEHSGHVFSGPFSLRPLLILDKNLKTIPDTFIGATTPLPNFCFILRIFSLLLLWMILSQSTYWPKVWIFFILGQSHALQTKIALGNITDLNYAIIEITCHTHICSGYISNK